jgi:hypothetical protein
MSKEKAQHREDIKFNLPVLAAYLVKATLIQLSKIIYQLMLISVLALYFAVSKPLIPLK